MSRAQVSPSIRSKRANAICIVAALLCISAWSEGCGGVLKVTSAKPASPTQPSEACKSGQQTPCLLPGVPFYTVGYRCLHTTVWIQPVYLVTFSASSDGKTLTTLSRFLGRREFEDDNVQSVLAKISKASASDVDASEYQKLLDDFRNIVEFNPILFDPLKILTSGSKEYYEVQLASNSVTSERYVDASTIYFYNVNKPLVGSANAEVDLSNEGILSKASGQTEDKTLSTILSALPTSDLIKTAAGIGAANSTNPPAVPPASGKYKVSLQVQTRLYKHTRTAYDSTQKPPCSPTATLVGANGATDFNFTVEDITTPPKPPATPEKPSPAPGGTGGAGGAKDPSKPD
jgi:hypothetical protein